jgi:UDP-N-acetylmuramate--alanine ligase
MYTKKAHIHFIGIGGIGMSGIAKILKHQGYIVSGCDQNSEQKSTQELRALGCPIYSGNDTPSCNDASIDILVYSSAIAVDNPEIRRAQERGIPTIARALMLAELMRTKYSIAIAGAHGKTTTTSLIAHVLIEAQYDPTVIIGGHLINISSNARMGSGDFLVAEADESDRSFLHLQATLALVTNIDYEHPETYADLDDAKQTYRQFLNNLPFYGKAFLCIDDPAVASLLPMPHLKIIKYGLNPAAHISARAINFTPTSTEFILTEYGADIGEITIHMPGSHNLLNCLGAIAIARDLGVAYDTIANALTIFKGVERRFWYRGTYKDAEVFDDYAHHPNEIEHALRVAKRRAKGRLVVIFQPHRYKRTYYLWQDFLEVFKRHTIDELIVTDIYAASETPIAGVCAQKFAHELQQQKPELKVRYVACDEQFAHLMAASAEITQENDLLLLLGAGRLTYLAHKLVTSPASK